LIHLGQPMFAPSLRREAENKSSAERSRKMERCHSSVDSHKTK
jgi:hypothetical protein